MTLIIFDTNVLKLSVCLVYLFILKLEITAQDDPISQELKKQEKQEYLGAKFSEEEAYELDRINKKYEINEKEIQARSKQKSGQKIGLGDKYHILRANRKDYMREKKFNKFKEKKVLNKQSEKTKERMLANKKKADSKYRKEKKKRKRKSFFNHFR
ncbi:MAG: hypothetical protein U0W24_07030 [Bacteroidales bacterium]